MQLVEQHVIERKDPQQIDQVRIVSRNGHYVVEVIYSKEPVQAQGDPSFCVAIDLGVTNLAAITSNREGFIPRLVNGRTLKAMNQWYNKRMKELTLCSPKEERERVTKQIEQITNKRNWQVNHYQTKSVDVQRHRAFLELCCEHRNMSSSCSESASSNERLLQLCHSI